MGENISMLALKLWTIVSFHKTLELPLMLAIVQCCCYPADPQTWMLADIGISGISQFMWGVES